MRRLSQFLCGLGGHEFVRQYEPNRLSLRCMACRFETSGWVLKAKPLVAAMSPNTAPLALMYVQKTMKRFGLAFGRPALDAE